MFIVLAAKVLVFGFMMGVTAFASLATGLIFGSFLIAMARNPLEKDTLFSNAMIGFVLVESFVFTALLIAVGVNAFL